MVLLDYRSECICEMKGWRGLHWLVVGRAAGGLLHSHQLQEGHDKPFCLDEADITMRTEIIKLWNSRCVPSTIVNTALNAEQCRQGKRCTRLLSMRSAK